jgi:hypothetical protein
MDHWWITDVDRVPRCQCHRGREHHSDDGDPHHDQDFEEKTGPVVDRRGAGP